MEKIAYREERFEIRNPSPLLMASLRMKKQTEKRIRAHDEKTIRDFALKLDKKIMKMKSE